jgi:hypothetical protein
MPSQLNWFFVNSATCQGYQYGPPFYLVIFLICPQNNCVAGSELTRSNVGFVEVVDNPSDPMDVFQNNVTSNNPLLRVAEFGQSCLNPGHCKGIYRSASGHDLTLDLRGHEVDSETTGITSIDGTRVKKLSDWSLAEGDIISSRGDGVITINNIRLGTQLILDFSDAAHPCRRSGPNCM